MTLNDEVERARHMKFVSAAFYAFCSFFIIVVNKSILTEYKWVILEWCVITCVIIIIKMRVILIGFLRLYFSELGRWETSSSFINLCKHTNFSDFILFIHRWQLQSSSSMLPKWTKWSIFRTLTPVFLERWCIVCVLSARDVIRIAWLWLCVYTVDFPFTSAVFGESRDRTGRN